MANLRPFRFFPFAAFLAFALAAGGQSVISTRSGVVHFFEGAVTVAGRPLEQHAGKFTTIPEGAELRTGEGRAEILLTPGVILRVGERSAIRLDSNALADTRVELLAGSAIVDSDQLNSANPVTVSYKSWTVKVLQRGGYRLDSDPPRLWVRQGQAEVSSGESAEPVSVTRGMSLAFEDNPVAERSIDPPTDGLTAWDQGRNQSISADNAISSQISDDPASVIGDPGQDAFTYFPMVGLSAAGISTAGAYNPYGLYQPGFYSLYLPGYTYRPLMLMVGPGAYRSPLYAQPLRISPGIGMTLNTPGTIITGSGIHPAGAGLGPRVGVSPVRPVTPVRPSGIHVGHR